MDSLKITRTGDYCYIASIGRHKSAKYGSREGAVTALAEQLARDLQRATTERVHDGAEVPCVCNGWGEPTGCRGCGIRSMGG